jgi:hypothetical protein
LHLTPPQEWLVDLFSIADRRGEAAEFAEAYDASELRKARCRFGI